MSYPLNGGAGSPPTGSFPIDPDSLQLDSIQNSLIAQYKDADLGATINNTKAINQSLKLLTNITPVSLSVQADKRAPRKVITLTRGKWFRKKQQLSFTVCTDHTEYIVGLGELEKIISVFLKKFVEHEKTLSDIGFEKFTNAFNTYNLDTLPETMYYVHNQFTSDVLMWTRFKKLFAIIDLSIDPVIVDTVKWKFFRYLLDQRRTTIIDEHPTEGMIKIRKPPSELHKLMDLMLYLPYGYLFYIHKHINIT